LDEYVGAEREGERLDVFASNLLLLSRSNVQRHIEEGNILVNEALKPKRYLLKEGDIVSCNIPEPKIYNALPEPIPLDIIYEDTDIIIINKPQGMVVHPAPGHYSGTLVNGLLYHCKDLSGINGVMRPGIVHRLDKDTSGLIAVAKTDAAHISLAAQLADRTMGRIYNGITTGVLKEDKITINKNIGRHPSERKKMAVCPEDKGRNAITHVRVLDRFKAHTLIEAKLETGRTHQIRVHMAYKGYPLLGDIVYGSKKPVGKGQYLHAGVLSFSNPKTGENMRFEAALPEYFSEALDKHV